MQDQESWKENQNHKLCGRSNMLAIRWMLHTSFQNQTGITMKIWSNQLEQLTEDSLNRSLLTKDLQKAHRDW